MELGYNVVEVLRPKRDKARPGEGKNDPLDAEARGARRRPGGLLRAEVAGRLGRGGAPALRRAQAGRRDVHVLRGLREVDAHDGPGRPEGAGSGAASGRRTSCRCSRAGGRRATRSRRACWPRCGPSRRSGRRPAASRVLDERIRALLEANAPALLGVEGCGTTTAAARVVAAGDNPGRLKGEAAFSMMCGASPRSRVEREDGPAQAQPRRQPAGELGALRDRDQAHGVRREDEEVRGEADLRGKSRREAVRCLKRYIAREVYHVLMDLNSPTAPRRKAPELAKMRKAMRVTQKKAAAELGLSAATLGHLERGETAVDETGEEVLRAPVRIGERSRKPPLDNL